MSWVLTEQSSFSIFWEEPSLMKGEIKSQYQNWGYLWGEGCKCAGFVRGGVLCFQQMLVGSVVIFELQDRCGGEYDSRTSVGGAAGLNAAWAKDKLHLFG